jgi:pyruvate formate lyase activating enzyme
MWGLDRKIMPAVPLSKQNTSDYPGRYWHRVEDNAIYCDLCPRACVLKEGDRGFCFVRKHEDGIMKLTTYGKSTGFCIDPIEKKPLNHFLPGTSVFSFGTAGCNLGCQFCQNWSISKSREVEILSEAAGPEEIAEAAVRLGCSSVAFTYNDPVIWAEYAIDTAKACKQAGIRTVAVTAGYITPEARPEFYSVMDAANVDLKGFTERFYQRNTLSSMAPVLDTLKWLKHESNVWFEITNLMIPGENDSAKETASMCDWIVTNLGDEVPLHFTAFHPDFRMNDKPPTPHATLTRARDQARKAGIKFAYVGNVNDEAGQSTQCPGCASSIVTRNCYEIRAYNLKGNSCQKCGEKIPGVFAEKPGNWGPRRAPVSFNRP